MKAVVLAAGRGTRMKASSPGDPPLDVGQRAVAEAGTKTLLPFHGHPLMSHILAALADGGIDEVCLVVGPGEDPVRRHYEGLQTDRLRISFAVQKTPTGSAHALLAAEPFAGADPVLVVNGDNLYPSDVVRSVCRLPGDGLAVFHAAALAREGGIPLVSMTCWRFTHAIFDACRRVAPSLRGEYELPDAVLLIEGDISRLEVHDFRTGELPVFESEALEVERYAQDGHGGGDWRLFANWVEAVAKHDASLLTSSLSASVESHVMAFAAERSRHQGTVEPVRV